MSQNEVVLSVSDFVAVLNQTLEVAYPNIKVVGELANFRVSKNRWVYFDLQDDLASLKFFGTVYQLPGPLQDGMLLQVRGNPRLHSQYGFSVTVQSILPVGEGSLKKAAALLRAKLEAEGLFDPARKRTLPYPPQRIGLITSAESAAYADFGKILAERWVGLEIELANVQVQGELAVGQIVRAIEFFNAQAQPPQVLVITRGGGSADDLAVFNTEQVTRAVAASRICTLVAIGHEVDLSLAELAADQRASTPSNAAQLLVPDKFQELQHLATQATQLGQLLSGQVSTARGELQANTKHLQDHIKQLMTAEQQNLQVKQQLLQALSPTRILERGYALVYHRGKIVRSRAAVPPGSSVNLQLADGQLTAKITSLEVQ